MSGEWRPGEPIPSEIDLASRYSVSQGTVRKAVSELAEERVLVRQQGRGTFVASHAEERSQFPFLRVTPDRGRAQGAYRGAARPHAGAGCGLPRGCWA